MWNVVFIIVLSGLIFLALYKIWRNSIIFDLNDDKVARNTAKFKCCLYYLVVLFLMQFLILLVLQTIYS